MVDDGSWLSSVFANALSYAIIVLPVVFLVAFGHKWSGSLRISHPYFYRLLVWLIGEQPSNTGTSPPARSDHGHGHGGGLDLANCCSGPQLMKFVICVVGLQLSFLSWGVLQERMVTLNYGDKKFKDSLFLVFGNRSLAFIIAMLVLWLRKTYLAPNNLTPAISNAQQEMPFYCYLYASLSNITATWFQYEALKYVSFPLQVLSKTLKIIAVMVLGRCVQRKTYPARQYLLATSITLGVTLFLFGNESFRSPDKINPTDNSVVSFQLSDGSHIALSLSGIVLLICYLAFDSFTSNWEERLFTQYPQITSYDMMAGINCWGTLLCTTALFVQGGFSDAWEFMSESKEFALHVVLLAISSAVGSLFIYYTISTFGAVVFVTIMTVRQALAIFLSCLVYGHEITPVGMLGLFLVFVSLSIQIYLRRPNKPKSQLINKQKFSSEESSHDQRLIVPLIDKNELPSKPTAV